MSEMRILSPKSLIFPVKQLSIFQAIKAHGLTIYRLDFHYSLAARSLVQTGNLYSTRYRREGGSMDQKNMALIQSRWIGQWWRQDSKIKSGKVLCVALRVSCSRATYGMECDWESKLLTHPSVWMTILFLVDCWKKLCHDTQVNSVWTRPFCWGLYFLWKDFYAPCYKLYSNLGKDRLVQKPTHLQDITTCIRFFRHVTTHIPFCTTKITKAKSEGYLENYLCIG